MFVIIPLLLRPKTDSTGKERFEEVNGRSSVLTKEEGTHSRIKSTFSHSKYMIFGRRDARKERSEVAKCEYGALVITVLRRVFILYFYYLWYYQSASHKLSGNLQ